MLRRGAAGAGLEEAAAAHQRHDGEHLGAGAEFEDGIEVGVEVTQDIAGDRYGVLAGACAFYGQSGGLVDRQKADIQAAGVVPGQVGIDLFPDFYMVGTVLV